MHADKHMARAKRRNWLAIQSHIRKHTAENKMEDEKEKVGIFIGKLDIFPLMCATDKVWITELTLIHKNNRLVRNSHISQSEVKHIMTSLIKTITWVLKVLTDIITSITAYFIVLAAKMSVCRIRSKQTLSGRTAILTIMYVETSNTDVIVF